MTQQPFNKGLTTQKEGEDGTHCCELSPHEKTGYFNSFVSSLPAMTFSIDTEGSIQAVSDLWLTKMAYERNEVIGRKFTEFLTNKSMEYVEKTILPDVVVQKSVENIACRFLKTDGTIIDVLLSANLCRNQHSLYKNVSLVTMCDITTYKLTQDTLKISEELYKSAQKIGKVGHWEFNLKTRTFWGSDEAKHIYGFDPGKEIFSIADVEECIPDRHRVHQALVDLIEKDRPYNLEFEIHPYSGSEKKYIKSIAELAVNESGIPEKVDGVILDITDIKLADEKLKKSEERYRQLFNSIRDRILITDTDRNIIDCNQSFIKGFGYCKEEIIGRKTRFLYESEEEYLRMKKDLKKNLDQGCFTYKTHFKAKSGDVFPGESNVFYLKNDNGDLVGFIGIIEDLTDRRKVEKSLNRANHALGRKSVELGDTNTALKVLLKKREQDSQELQENIYSNYELMITPFLNKLKNRSTNSSHQNLVNIIETNLNEIIAPFTKKLSNPMMSLTSGEIQIANMIKQDYSNKEIATILNCSKRTVDTHRQNIRKKLKLNNEKINLKTFLLNI